MTKKRKHSKAEIAFKLAEADDLVPNSNSKIHGCGDW